MSKEFKFTKEDQIKAIGQIVDLINKYKLKLEVDHQIQFIPLEPKEAVPNEKKNV